MHREQVPLVAQQRIQRALPALRRTLHLAQPRRRLVQDFCLRCRRQSAPRSAPESHHLVQHAGPLDRQRDGGQRRCGNLFGRHTFHYREPRADLRRRPAAVF